MPVTDLSALNTLQAEAVTSMEKRVLVLAGAGSGKTKTLLQKIIWLIEEKEVSPRVILAITFTRNAANEMIDRLILTADASGRYAEIINDKSLRKQEKENARRIWQKKFKWIDGTTIRTFHSFCYSVLRDHGVNQFDNRFRIIGEEKKSEEDEFARFTAPETVFEVFHKLFIESCDDQTFLLDLKRYVLDYFVDRIHLDKTHKPDQPRDGRFYTTLDGKKVRSKSEQSIADWLFRHSIRYEYEPQLKITDFAFRPDFYIPDANLYIEHVSDKSYSMRDKEEQFRKGKVLYVKTFESMTKDSALFNHALDKIIRGRLPSDYHLTTGLIYREEFHGYRAEVKEFIQQVIRITDMIKIENDDPDEILKRAESDAHERVRNFYRLAIPVVKKYKAYCINKSYLDFNDMISECISLFRNQEDISGLYRNRFKYILVDEFQDVNNLQVELIKLMLTENTHLFCVGDDWQSIYGFRGSNVSYIIDFERHFPDAQIVKLMLNYRSHQHIVGASNEVISHNQFKIEKEVTASRKSESRIVVHIGNTEEENLQFCVNTVRELLDEGFHGDEILFLYRRSRMYFPYADRFREENLRVNAKTIHAAKGLEARVVFVVGLTEGQGGFPDIWLEDRIFRVVRQANYDLLMEEERRLFYVALTRAKERLFLITEKGCESTFLREVPEEFTVKTTLPLKPVVEKIETCRNCLSILEKMWKVCPWCGTPVESEVADKD